MKIKLAALAVLALGGIFFTNVTFAGDSTTNAVSSLTADALRAYEAGNYDLAVTDFTKLIQLHETDAYLGRGLAYEKQQQYEKAIEDLTEAIRRRPSAIAFKSRGDIYAHQKIYENAVIDYSEAIKLNSTNADLYELRAMDYILQKNFDAAIIDCNTALLILNEISGTNQLVADAYFIRGIALKNKSDYERALADFNKALQFYPHKADVLIKRSEIFLQLGKYKDATTDLRSAIELKPDYWRSYNGLAFIQSACTDSSFRDGLEAIRNAKEACRLSQWKNAECIETLAASYAEIKNFDKAVTWQQKAIEFGLKDETLTNAQKKLELYKQKKPFRM